MNIAYMTAGDRSFASSRLRCFKPGEALAQMGHLVAYNPIDPLSYEILVVQKRADCIDLMQAARNLGSRVVFDCDDQMLMDTTYADQVTVDTPAKLTLYENAVVVPDCLDIEPDSPRKTWHAHELKSAVWVGNPENVEHIRYAAMACREHSIALTVITDLTKVDWVDYPNVTGYQWSLETVDAEMVKHDLFIAPFVFDGQWGEAWVRSKSANRLYKSWALGLPVAGTNIPAYFEAGLKYAASSPQEWMGVLEALKALGARVVDATRGSMRAQAYRAECVAETWMKVFSGS